MRFPESPVEPITKLCKISTEMTIANTTINTMNGTLDISNQGMNPGQNLYRIPPRAGNYREMLNCVRVQTPISSPSICDNLSLLSKLIPETLGDLVSSRVLHLFHSGKTWSVAIYLYCYYDFSFSLCPSTPFSWFRRPRIGIINLNKTGKFVVRIPFSHGFADLLAHSPYRFIASYLKHTLKRKHGDATFLSGHQKDHPKPLPQGSPGFVKDCSCSEGHPVFASLALIQIADAVKRSLIMATTRTAVSLRPSKVEKGAFGMLSR